MDADQANDERREIARLLDEVEQLRTALEASFDESAKLAEDRDRLLRRVTEQARELQAANRAYARASVVSSDLRSDTERAQERTVETNEELRVAFEEMQVLTEELEVANTSLHEVNKTLDRRVEERTQQLEQKNAALRQSELRFRTLVEGMPQLVWRAVNGGEWTWASPQWTAYTGLSAAESKGHGWLRALHPDDRQAAEAEWVWVKAGESLEFEARIYHVGEQRCRHFRIRALAAREGDGEATEWLGTATDIDDLLTLQHQQTVLVMELQHRTRNLLGVIQAILLRTIKGSRTLEEFQVRIGERMAALARVQGLLSRRNEGQRVTVEALLRAEVSAHVVLDQDGKSAQVAISGPADIGLRSANVQTLALALHELMTNAVKYGALSTPNGHLDISWQNISGDDGTRRLLINWRETGVADMPSADAPPRGSGYGRELIERALPYQLGAKTSYMLAEDGVRCSIEMEVA